MACEGKRTAKLTYTRANGNKVSTEFPAPINVETEHGAKLWRYGGSGVNTDCSPIGTYEFTAQGENASITTRSDNPSFPGCTIQVIVIDGIEQYGAFAGDAYLIPEDEECIIKVVDKNFQDSYKCGTEYEITCDEDCPKNHMKCKCSKYPGYCCLPCSDIVPKIKNLASKLKNNV